MPSTETISFGILLKQLRKRAGMTQRDLAAALNYSDSLISSLENAHRQPDVEAVATRFVQALGLQDDPASAAHLIELAAAARGKHVPASVTLQQVGHVEGRGEPDERTAPLPLPPTELIGRSDEVNALCNRLLGHGGRLLTLVGPPGIGKTRLALAVTARLQHLYPDAAVFVPLAEVTDGVWMASTINAALGIRDAGPKPPKTQLVEFLRRKSMLLVLDNCEQIPDAAPLVAELLAACPGLVVLATSRERLHLRAEQRCRVPPLELDPAVELFAERATSVDAGFVLTTANRPIVEAICRRLDCLPLALELCAAEVDLLSPAQLLAQLQQRSLDLLVDGAHDLPPQHRTLRHAIHRSVALLSEEERSLFRSLGVFAGGFALPELESLCAENQDSDPRGEAPGPLATLHALIGKSLVRVETLPSGEQRYMLLETIREFALEQLRAQGDEGLLRARHFAVYLQLFQTGDIHLRGAESVTWLARLQPEQDNLRAALQWALDQERYVDAAWLMLAVSYFGALSGFGGYEEARWLAQLLPHRQALATDLRLAILLTFFRTAFALEEFQPIDSWMPEIMQLLEGGVDKSLHSAASCYLAWTTSDAAQAAANWERGIACARAAAGAPELGAEFGAFADSDFVLAIELWGYATFLIDQGEVARATPIADESLHLFRRRGNRTGIGECLGTLGRLALLRGDLAEAYEHFQEVVTIATTLGYTGMESEWQSLLAITTLYQGDASEARRLLNESLRRCLERRNTILLAQVCTYLAEVSLWEGELDQAEHWLTQSLGYQADSPRVTLSQVERLFVAARLATAQEDYRRAATLLGAAERAHGQIHYAYAGPVRAQVDAALAKVCAALGPEAFAEAFAAEHDGVRGLEIRSVE